MPNRHGGSRFIHFQIRQDPGGQLPGNPKNLNNPEIRSIRVHFQQFGEISRKEAHKQGLCLKLRVVADFRNYNRFLLEVTYATVHIAVKPSTLPKQTRLPLAPQLPLTRQ